MENKIFDSREAAAYLHICYDTLVRSVRKNEIPHFKVGRKLLFRKDSLDEFIRKQEDGANDDLHTAAQN
ncbi:helix-turn-helix domain-containing protein [Aminipila terrae]|uniref:Helix-turn-helix domain-containing protein n=1 Tax=Aminipila terrae TaxID=2697030 RepID=A0A6P1MGJ7_9FIRM|nr:helix-turn-helix domain-containing protein [Aminipila terrae]QHI72871.1 helix-turn-helix domain-containing protein [Aminipila terrae]